MGIINLDEFEKDISEKNYTKIKSNIVSGILNNPDFSDGNVDGRIEKLKAELPQIFEEKKTYDFENKKDEIDWDYKYLVDITCNFEENFSLERIDEIKKVGRVVEEQRKQERMEEKSVPQEAPVPKKDHKKLMLIIGILAVIIIAVIMALVIKQ